MKVHVFVPLTGFEWILGMITGLLSSTFTVPEHTHSFTMEAAAIQGPAAVRAGIQTANPSIIHSRSALPKEPQIIIIYWSFAVQPNKETFSNVVVLLSNKRIQFSLIQCNSIRFRSFCFTSLHFISMTYELWGVYPRKQELLKVRKQINKWTNTMTTYQTDVFIFDVYDQLAPSFCSFLSIMEFVDPSFVGCWLKCSIKPMLDPWEVGVGQETRIAGRQWAGEDVSLCFLLVGGSNGAAERHTGGRWWRELGEELEVEDTPMLRLIRMDKIREEDIRVAEMFGRQSRIQMVWLCPADEEQQIHGWSTKRMWRTVWDGGPRCSAVTSEGSGSKGTDIRSTWDVQWGQRAAAWRPGGEKLVSLLWLCPPQVLEQQILGFL